MNSDKKTRRHPWLPVVAAIIRRDKMVLMGRRPESGNLAGLWEFPGGKIEFGESPEKALFRELKEELDIEADVGSLKFAVTHNYGETCVLILFYEVVSWRGQPKCAHHTEIRWMNAAEIPGLSLPDANRIVLDRVVSLLK